MSITLVKCDKIYGNSVVITDCVSWKRGEEFKEIHEESNSLHNRISYKLVDDWEENTSEMV